LRARKICATAGCFELQPCPDHRKKSWQKTGEEPDRLRGPKATARRRYILDRDSFTCHLCGETRLADQLVADHVVPLSQGGPDTVQNLKAACLDCHAKKSQAEAAEGRNYDR